MQNKNKIAIDVDMVIVPNDSLGVGWWEHLVEYYHDCQTLDQYKQFCDDYARGEAEYDLTKYFTLPNGFDRLSWFKQDLYDNIPIAEGCYDVIKNMYEANFEIYFVSYCQPEHEKSKENYLRRHFDFLLGEDFHFVSTKSKGCMDGSVFMVVDDRMEFMNQFKQNCLRILFDTPYKQEYDAQVDYVKCKTWDEIEDVFCGALEDYYEG